MKSVFALAGSIFFFAAVYGQQGFKSNAVYCELGGAGLLFSANYEHQLTKKAGFGFRGGFGIYNNEAIFFTIPIGINYLASIGKTSFLDIGFTTTYCATDVRLYMIIDRKDPMYVNRNYLNFIPSIGWRGQSKKAVMARFAFTPVINNNGFIPYIGLSIGKLF